MDNSLGGVIFCYNPIKFDYCIEESIRNLQELVDELVILDAGSDDGSQELLKKYEDQYTSVVLLDSSEWHRQQGREKLAYFQNLALSFLNTEYYFLLQADEIIHEASFEIIYDAVNSGKEAFYCSRFNLWGSPDTFLVVPENRQPCSTRIIRLAKTKYKSVGDGESIEAPAIDDYLNEIRIYHYGYVRNRKIMKEKVIHLQENVFQLGHHDPKLDGADEFISERWFSGEDLRPIGWPHSKFIKDWAKQRT